MATNIDKAKDYTRILAALASKCNFVGRSRFFIHQTTLTTIET